MTQRFTGKSAVVSGGAGGIGLAICRRLARERAFVWIVDSNEAAATHLGQVLRGGGGRTGGRELSDAKAIHVFVGRIAIDIWKP